MNKKVVNALLFYTFALQLSDSNNIALLEGYLSKNIGLKDYQILNKNVL